MNLDKQVKVYSLDTSDFYTDTEKLIQKRLSFYKKKKLALKQFATANTGKKNKILAKLNQRIKLEKENLKNCFETNTEIRVLNQERLSEKRIISVFESFLTRTLQIATNEFSKDILVIQTFYFAIMQQLILNGFIFENEKYIFFTASAGQIRTKKNVFIKQSVFEKYKKTLMCGLDIDTINGLGGVNVNKFLAYLALSNSATESFKEFDIDKAIVIDDFETKISATVDFVDDKNFSVTRKQMEVPITHSDGCGMILPKLSSKNFMVRLPWVKGLLASFDFIRFIKENNANPVVKDIYGISHNLLEENIEIIFTKSQFKMWHYYSSFEHYKKCFKENFCEASICNIEPDVPKEAYFNYQMLQTLTDISDNELVSLASKSNELIRQISTGKNKMLEVFKATRINENSTWYQKALNIYPELLDDEYSKKVLRQIKNSLIKNFKSGKLKLECKYAFIIPDLYAFCENKFLGIENPNGLLQDGEVTCKLFEEDRELDCLRSPHLYLEHAIRKNIRTENCERWFNTNGIYTSCKDMITKIIMNDNDGDTCLITAETLLVEIAKRNIKKWNIVPLYYEMKKAGSTSLSNDIYYNGLISAYKGGKIGIISNEITKIWNSSIWYDGSFDEQLEALELIKCLVAMNNYVIDYAKTLYKPNFPVELEEKIKKFTNQKVPYFFHFSKDKTLSQVENINHSTCNRLTKIIKNTRLNFNKNIGQFKPKYLLSNLKITPAPEVIDLYLELQSSHRFRMEQKSKYKNLNTRTDLVNKFIELGYSYYDVAHMLVKYLYFIEPSKDKSLLWFLFGRTIYETLQSKLPKNSIVCPKCKERFVPQNEELMCKFCSSKSFKYQRTLSCSVCGEIFRAKGNNIKKPTCDKCKKIKIVYPKKRLSKKITA